MTSKALHEWHRRVTLDIAQAFPLTPAVRIRASGNHLSSQNDEPEPTTADDSHLAEEAAIAADLARNVNKGQTLAQRNDEAALAAQVMNLDAMRRAGW